MCRNEREFAETCESDQRKEFTAEESGRNDSERMRPASGASDTELGDMAGCGPELPETGFEMKSLTKMQRLIPTNPAEI